MQLYDVFWRGNAMDSARRLPDAGPDIRYAACVNGKREYLRPVKTAEGWKWREVSHAEALATK